MSVFNYQEPTPKEYRQSRVIAWLSILAGALILAYSLAHTLASWPMGLFFITPSLWMLYLLKRRNL